MRLWRIAAEKYALDKACAATRLTGGRWNPIGYPALYVGTTVEICALERFVHSSTQEGALVLVSVDVPNHRNLFYKPSVRELPRGWAHVPVVTSSQEFGRAWLQEARELVMLLPSAVIPEAAVAVINPAHRAYGQVKLRKVRRFTFDPRMYKH